MEVLQWARQHKHHDRPARRWRPSRCRSRSWAGPPPWTCKTPARRCAGSSAPPRAGCPPGGSSPPCTGTSSPAAWTWKQRSQGSAYQDFAGDGLPRDGGMADLLAEAASPAPRFAAVICEDIERSGRDTFNALKLEKKLSRQGIPLFATDEPADIEGVNATTVLVRRVKQGVAEWYRLQLKEKTWKGLVEHSLDGWNIGPAPYGYLAERIPHPVPFKAAQGRTKTRLVLDPARAPVVAQIFTWRVVDKLGMPAIAARLNADPARYPPPARGRVDRPGRARPAPQPQVHRAHGLRPASAPATATASPSPRPVAVDTRARPPRHRGPGHLGRRPGHRRRARHQPGRRRTEHPPRHAADLPLPVPGPVPGLPTGGWPASTYGARRSPPTTGAPTTPPTPATPPPPRPPPHRPGPRDPPGPGRRASSSPPGLRPRPRRAARRPAPRHRRRRPRRPRRPGRRPRGPAQADRHRAGLLDPRTRTAPRRPGRHRLRRDARPDPRPVRRPPRRTRAAEAQLDALARPPPAAADPALLDELPLAGDILPGLPAALKARLLAVFDIWVLWNKTDRQATVYAEITDDTLRAVPAILDPGQDGYHDTSPAPSTDNPTPLGHLISTSRRVAMAHRVPSHAAVLSPARRDSRGGTGLGRHCPLAYLPIRAAACRFAADGGPGPLLRTARQATATPAGR